MEFIYRKKSQENSKDRLHEKILSNLNISNNLKHLSISNSNYEIAAWYNEDVNIDNLIFYDDKRLIIISAVPENIKKLKSLCNSTHNHCSKILLDYYLKFGESLFDAIEGEVSILIYLIDDDLIISSIDRFGLRHLFCYVLNEEIVLSSKISFILAIKELDLSLNKKRLKDFLETKISNHTYTFYNEIFKVNPSNFLKIIDHKSYFQHKYYDISKIKPNHSLSLKQASKLIKESLISSLDIEDNSSKKIGVLFSGGLDSSSIISVLASYNINLYGISAIYKDIEINKINLIDESVYQDTVYLKYKNINKFQFEASNNSIIENIDKYLQLIGEPFFFPNLYLTDKSYQYAYKNELNTVYNGNDGDTVISHGYEVLFYYFIFLRWYKLFKEIRKISIIRKIKMRTVFKKLVYKRYLKPFLYQLYKKNSHDRKIHISPYKNHLESINSTLHQDSIYKHSCIALYYGIEEKYPFYNMKMILNSLKVSSKYKFMNGMNRFILRDAMKGFLPKQNYNRADKSNLAYALCLNLYDNKEIIERELEKPNEMIINYLDINALRDDWKYFKRSPYSHATSSKIPTNILNYIILNKWLTIYTFSD